MRSFVLGALFPALALAAPAAKRADASPTLITFTLDGQLVTATYYGTSTAADASCPTQTFTYEGAVITEPYLGPGTPQSCLSVTPCPTQTFTYNGAVITAPYLGPGAPQSCFPNNGASATPHPITSEAAPTSAPVQTSEPASISVPATTPAVTSETSTPTIAATSATSASSAASASKSPVLSSGVPKGFNYGSAGMTESIYETQFNVARNLVGTNGGFTSARLYTSIQDGTTNGIISAIPAAIATKTKLLLGLFYPNVDNEIIALKAAIAQYGSEFADLVVAISVGSEDLYRDSALGQTQNQGTGASPDQLVSFIQATRSAIAGTVLADKLVGHVDTFNSWTNSSNAAVISAVDFIGMDAYPYYQTTDGNAIGNGRSLFEIAYQKTQAVANGKPIWITETGWPVTGPTEAQAVPNAANAESYWQQVGCGFAFDKIPTFWFDLVDGGANPSFGVTGGSTTPLYDLSCSA